MFLLIYSSYCYASVSCFVRSEQLLTFSPSPHRVTNTPKGPYILPNHNRDGLFMGPVSTTAAYVVPLAKLDCNTQLGAFSEILGDVRNLGGIYFFLVNMTVHAL